MIRLLSGLSANCAAAHGEECGSLLDYRWKPVLFKGVHNLRHTLGQRLRGAAAPLETRKAWNKVDREESTFRDC
jgi:hypothetical protein